MFIKNQAFKDEDTLLEMLFDFGLGEASPMLAALLAGIDKDLEQNTAYQDYYNSLATQDDKDELYHEELDLRLSEILMGMFTSFVVSDAKLYGVKDGERTLLYQVDLH